MGKHSTYSRLQVDSKVKCEAWPTSWRPHGTWPHSFKCT